MYAPLRFDAGGRHHLMLGQGVGRDALLRVLHDMPAAALAHTRVLYVPDPPAAAAFDAAGIGGLQILESVPALLQELQRRLDASFMGTRLYVAGPESFIGRAMQIALSYNLKQDEMLAEECGTRARRVYCIHCRSTLENVRTNIVCCDSCGRWLLVRDHYSRRLATYMGVMVDAEAPGDLPPIHEVFV